MKKILISGCSFTQCRRNDHCRPHDYKFWAKHWVDYLFPHNKYSVLNLGRSVAGNRYIASSILSNIDLNNKPDYVFILWSGVRRIDIPIPPSSTTELLRDYLYNASENECNNVNYFFTGGNHNLPPVKNFIEQGASEIFQDIADMYYSDTDDKLCNQLSLESISSVTNFLDNHKIKYNFSFIYNPLSKGIADDEPSLGLIDKTNAYYQHINWDNYINFTPFEYGLKHDFIYDGMHLTVDGMCQWAEEIKKYIPDSIIN